MDVPTFFKEYDRMCHYHRNGCDCGDCPLIKAIEDRHGTCLELCKRYPEKSVAIVEQWAKEHPAKTYKRIFLEKFPDAPLSIIGDPIACIKDIFAEAHEIKGCDGHEFCHECWNLEMEE